MLADKFLIADSQCETSHQVVSSSISGHRLTSLSISDEEAQWVRWWVGIGKKTNYLGLLIKTMNWPNTRLHFCQLRSERSNQKTPCFNRCEGCR